MANISDNIAQFLQEKGISVRALEAQIGCSNGVISRCINKGTDISTQWVSKIIDIFPDLNPTWLLSGKGDMLLSSNSNSEESENISAEKLPNDEIWGYLAQKDKEIGKLHEHIGELKYRVSCLERELAAARGGVSVHPIHSPVSELETAK